MIRDMIKIDRDTYTIETLEGIRPYRESLISSSEEVQVKDIDRYRNKGYFDRLLQKAVGAPSITWDILKITNATRSNNNLPKRIMLLDLKRVDIKTFMSNINKKNNNKKVINIDA